MRPGMIRRLRLVQVIRLPGPASVGAANES
jgi:hypothetical protein